MVSFSVINFLRLSLITAAFLALSFPFPVVLASAEDEFSTDLISELIITEIKLGGNTVEKNTTSYKEYVTIYNQSENPVDLQDWKLEYAKPDYNGACDVENVWNGGSTRSIVLSEDELLLEPSSVKTYELPMNDDDGSLRVINENLKHSDLVGWGLGANCFETSPFKGDTLASTWSKDMTLKRYLDCEINLPLDANNNSTDFSLSSTPTPEVLSYPDDQIQNCQDTSDDEQDDEGGMGGGADDVVQNSCTGIIITEVLPNPSGLDTGNEFIELYNFTDENISLKGCQLQTTANSKLYTFGEIELKAKQYKAFYDDTTGLTLNNSSGGSVYLIDTDNSEQEVEYMPSLDDDVAWAVDLSNNTWSITYSSTPGEKNKIVKIKPCQKGEFRNPETNRCNKIAVEAGLDPCPPGKFRNPETNRCKSILDTNSQLKPCNAGQFRNPETNRCKSLNSGHSLVPCKSNQERNPETNRCRKISDEQSLNDTTIKDVLSVSDAQNQTSWTLAGFSFAGAGTYAVWEWRNEIFERFLALKNKLGIK